MRRGRPPAEWQVRACRDKARRGKGDGAKSLLKLGSVIDTAKMKEPSFMMVITGVGQYAYRRADGVLVVPVGVLKN